MDTVPTSRFTLRRRLGEGGMGVVYEAFDEERRAPVALKTLHRIDAAGISRFKREFRALQGLAHPNLVALDELFNEEGKWFFTMELLDGDDFVAYVRGTRGGARSAFASTIHEGAELRAEPAAVGAADESSCAFDVARLRGGLRQLIEGLAALHASGRVHRDVKPSNVLVTPEGRVVLLDFGLVTESSRPETALSATSIVMGTPEYMAPEQAATGEVGPAADLYSVGVILHEILLGRLPFQGPPLKILMDKQVGEPPLRSAFGAHVPPELAGLCIELLRFDPAARPSTTEVLRALASSSVAPPRPRGGPSSSGHSFVGRELELRALRAGFARAARGDLDVVLVCGESGIGKSSMVRHFVAELTLERPDLVVLEGRCYEREAVPYKALDGIVDALARRLAHMPTEEVDRLLPPRSAALARMFPAMLHVPLVAKADASMALAIEPHDLRRRALSGLRDLFTRLATERPTIVALDDLQWADDDGLRALEEILRPPDSPPLLLVATVRTHTGGVDLERVRQALPGSAQVITLAPLGPEEARELAAALLRRAQAPGADPEAIADEARGHPLYVEELARHVALGGSARDEVKLDDAIGARVASLDPAARAVAELVAVAGRPLPQDVVATAARLEPAEFNRRVALLRAANLARTGGVRRADTIEPYHDRVREAVLGALAPERRRALHETLALAYEAPSGVLPGAPNESWASLQRDPETLAVHWREAGNVPRAATYATAAGDMASRAFAFDRAAEWYEQALSLTTSDPAARRALRVKLGDALASAGRGAMAAEHLESAAVESSASEALELRRRAADQLLRSGRFDRGIAASRAVLASIGMRLPATRAGTLLMLVYYRARLAVRGLRFDERDAATIPPAELARIDTCWSVGMALMFVDTFVGFIFLTRALLLALSAGELGRIARCVGMEVGVVGSEGVPSWKRTERLMTLARDLADRSGRLDCRFFALGAKGGALFCAGRFREGADEIERALALLEDRSLGLVHERVTLRVFLMDSMKFLGRLRDLRRLQRDGVRDARARGDLYAAVELTVGNGCYAWLVEDRPDGAESQARAVMGEWSTSGFHLEHMNDLEARTAIRLYTGDVAEAYAFASELRRRTRRSLLWQIQLVRWSCAYLSASAALAMLEKGLGDRKTLLSEVESGARAIERERMDWGLPFARVLRAGIALRHGRRPEAVDLLDSAARDLTASGLAVYALSARDRAARLRGGPDAEEEIARVAEALRAEDVVAPEKMIRVHVAGMLA